MKKDVKETVGLVLLIAIIGIIVLSIMATTKARAVQVGSLTVSTLQPNNRGVLGFEIEGGATNDVNRLQPARLP